MGLSSPAPHALHPIPTVLQSTSALLSNPYRLPAGCKEKPELSISLPSFHPRPTASFPLPGCLLWMLLWNNASCDKTNRQLWSQVCSLGRARRDSSSPFPETTAETCHIQGVPLRWPISPSQGFSPQMLGLVSDERALHDFEDFVSAVTWCYFSSDTSICHLRGGNCNPGFSLEP